MHFNLVQLGVSVNFMKAGAFITLSEVSDLQFW